jgi:hypothetical protein
MYVVPLSLLCALKASNSKIYLLAELRIYK